MALNIVAERKMSLEGFAEGWKGCYLILRAVNEEKRIKWGEILTEDAADKVNLPILRDAAGEVILGGKVMTTVDDEQKLVPISAEDIPIVVEALNVYWLQEVLLVSSGADRLKGWI